MKKFIVAGLQILVLVPSTVFAIFVLLAAVGDLGGGRRLPGSGSSTELFLAICMLVGLSGSCCFMLRTPKFTGVLGPRFIRAALIFGIAAWGVIFATAIVGALSGEGTSDRRFLPPLIALVPLAMTVYQFYVLARADEALMQAKKDAVGWEVLDG